MKPTPEQRILELALTFPAMCVKHREDPSGSGLDPFDAVRFSEASRPWSSGEKHAVSFLLTVYNMDTDLVPPFRVVDAMMVWDNGQRRAFADWAAAPFSL